MDDSPEKTFKKIEIGWFSNGISADSRLLQRFLRAIVIQGFFSGFQGFKG